MPSSAERMQAFYGKEITVGSGQIPLLREKLSSLSEYVKEIKQSFSRYFNKRHNRRGFLWGDRFESVMVANGGHGLRRQGLFES